MADRDPLADLFAQHAPHVGPITGAWTCPTSCGAKSTLCHPDGKLLSPPERVAEYRAHLAAAVRAFLASDETVEQAARGVERWWDEALAVETPTHLATASDEDLARAALAAATEARP